MNNLYSIKSRIVSIKLLILIEVFILLVAFLICIMYIDFFHEYFQEERYLNILNYTRIIAPDTFLYKSLINEDFPLQSIISSNVKNNIIPSAIWYIFNYNYYAVLMFNIAIIAIIVIYVYKLSFSFQIAKNRILLYSVLFIAIPSTLYYSIGSLKELITCFLLISFVYHFKKGHILKLAVVSLFIILVRYQLVVILLFIFFLNHFKNIQFRMGLFILLFISFLYPLLVYLDIFLYGDATKLYRIYYGKLSSIGHYIEIMRDIPILSIISICIRSIQTIFEPILSIHIAMFEDGRISIYALQQFISIVFLLPFLYTFFKKAFYVVFFGTKIKKDVQMIYIFILSYLILVGGFSFIHHRYLYPLFILIIVASAIPKTYMFKNKT